MPFIIGKDFLGGFDPSHDPTKTPEESIRIFREECKKYYGEYPPEYSDEEIDSVELEIDV